MRTVGHLVHGMIAQTEETPQAPAEPNQEETPQAPAEPKKRTRTTKAAKKDE